jgi:Holliday junction DNA helicase RuvA
MIARLSGTLIEKSITQCVVDIHGAGYRVVVPLTTFYELPDQGLPVVLHVHTHVREDAIHLYGFHSTEEREVFELLISVSGIGPKLAINVLSGIAARELIRAVTQEDLKRLTAIPGVGKKMAERIILELKDKMSKLDRGKVPTETTGAGPDERIKEDVLSALVNLGYKGSLVKEVVDRMMREASPAPSLDQLLKQALRVLAG